MTSPHDTPGKYIAWGHNHSTALEYLIADASENTKKATLDKMPKDLGLYVKSQLTEAIDDAIQVAIVDERYRLIRWLEVNGYGIGEAALKAILAEGQNESEPAPADAVLVTHTRFAIFAPSTWMDETKVRAVRVLRTYAQLSLREALAIVNSILKSDQPHTVDLPMIGMMGVVEAGRRRRVDDFMKEMASLGFSVLSDDALARPVQENPLTVKVPT